MSWKKEFEKSGDPSAYVYAREDELLRDPINGLAWGTMAGVWIANRGADIREFGRDPLPPLEPVWKIIGNPEDVTFDTCFSEDVFSEL